MGNVEQVNIKWLLQQLKYFYWSNRIIISSDLVVSSDSTTVSPFILDDVRLPIKNNLRFLHVSKRNCCFVDYCLFSCPLSFVHCVFCPAMNFFWSPLLESSKVSYKTPTKQMRVETMQTSFLCRMPRILQHG
jgi:hypothetical protein